MWVVLSTHGHIFNVHWDSVCVCGGGGGVRGDTSQSSFPDSSRVLSLEERPASLLGLVWLRSPAKTFFLKTYFEQMCELPS